MSVKPTKVTRTFTVEQRWTLTRDEIQKIICDHLGIPFDDDTHIELEEWSDTEVTRTTYDQQVE